MTNQTEPPCLTAEGEELRDGTIAAEVKRLLVTPEGQYDLWVNHDLVGDDDDALIALALFFHGSLDGLGLRQLFEYKARAIAEQSHAQHGVEYWNDLAKQPMEIDDD